MDELLGGVVGRRIDRCLIGDCMVNGCPPGGVGWLGSGFGSSSEATGITYEPSLDIHRGHSRAPNQFGWPCTVATDRGVKKSFDTAVCRDAVPVARCGPLPVSRVVWTFNRPPCSSTDAGSTDPSWACASTPCRWHSGIHYLRNPTSISRLRGLGWHCPRPLETAELRSASQSSWFPAWLAEVHPAKLAERLGRS